VKVPAIHCEGVSNVSAALTLKAVAASAAPSEVLIAPQTPERLLIAVRPSAAHLLHDIPSIPVMSSLLTKSDFQTVCLTSSIRNLLSL